VDLTEAGQEHEQVAVAGRCGRERLCAEHFAELVARGGDVDFGVGVDTADDNLGANVPVVMPVLSMQMSRSGTHKLAVGQDRDGASRPGSY
jgi:hypothetical protein